MAVRSRLNDVVRQERTLISMLSSLVVAGSLADTVGRGLAASVQQRGVLQWLERDDQVGRIAAVRRQE